MLSLISFRPFSVLFDFSSCMLVHAPKNHFQNLCAGSHCFSFHWNSMKFHEGEMCYIYIFSILFSMFLVSPCVSRSFIPHHVPLFPRCRNWDSSWVKASQFWCLAYCCIFVNWFHWIFLDFMVYVFFVFSHVAIVQFNFEIGVDLPSPTFNSMRGLKNPEIQRAFGISRRAVSKPVSFDEPGLPNFFCASGQQLVEAIARSIDCLETVEGTPGYMLIRDETVFSRSFGMVYGFDGDKPCIVGGIHPTHSKLFIEPGDSLALDRSM